MQIKSRYVVAIMSLATMVPILSCGEFGARPKSGRGPDELKHQLPLSKRDWSYSISQDGMVLSYISGREGGQPKAWVYDRGQSDNPRKALLADDLGKPKLVAMSPSGNYFGAVVQKDGVLKLYADSQNAIPIQKEISLPTAIAQAKRFSIQELAISETINDTQLIALSVYLSEERIWKLVLIDSSNNNNAKILEKETVPRLGRHQNNFILMALKIGERDFNRKWWKRSFALSDLSTLGEGTELTEIPYENPEQGAALSLRGTQASWYKNAGDADIAPTYGENKHFKTNPRMHRFFSQDIESLSAPIELDFNLFAAGSKAGSPIFLKPRSKAFAFGKEYLECQDDHKEVTMLSFLDTNSKTIMRLLPFKAEKAENWTLLSDPCTKAEGVFDLLMLGASIHARDDGSFVLNVLSEEGELRRMKGFSFEWKDQGIAEVNQLKGP